METNKYIKILAIIVGITICNNIFYLLNYNSFFLNISNIVSIISLVILLIKDRKRVIDSVSKIDKTFYFYLLMCIFSVIPCFFYFSKNNSLIMSFINGLPLLVLLYIQYLVIISFSDCKEELLKGIKIGFVLNIIYSLLQYVFFLNNGSVLTLYTLFPNNAFQVCGNYDKLLSMPAIKTTLTIFQYRIQGFFLETSHFTTFLCGAGLIALYKTKNKTLRIFLLILVSYLCIISESGNFIIFLGILLLFILKYIPKQELGKFTIKRKTLLMIPIILISILLLGAHVINRPTFFQKINDTFNSTNLEDAGNSDRNRTIKEGIALIQKYPMGIGYNMTSNILKMEYPTEKYSYIFSTVVLNELELGPIGNVLYLIFALKFIVNLLCYGKDKEDYVIALSTMGIFLCQASNGISFWNIQYTLAIYAIANIYYNELKKKRKGEKTYGKN